MGDDFNDELNDDLNEDPRVPLAIERTLLAWTRTGLALMGFGFLVAKVGATVDGRPSPWASILGALFIVTGAVVNVTATAQHKFGRYGHTSPGLHLSAILALFTGVLGGALAIYVAFF